MPVYEFYCSVCHTIFNFLAKAVESERKPACPKCRKPGLERKVSHFAISSGRKDEPSGGDMPDFDEAKLEKALMGMASEFDRVDGNDPRQLAKMMRRISEATGMNPGGDFEEAIRRLESGEDPETIEAEMGDVLDDNNLENMFTKEGLKGLKRRYIPPAHDETLYRFDQSDS